ncbi:MAG: MMPL family transporter [Thermoleophilia bacterium]
MTALASTERLARTSARHPWRTIALWLVALVLGLGAAGLLLGDALTTESDFTGTPESKAAAALLDERLPAADGDAVDEVLVLRAPGRSVDDAAFRAAVEGRLAELAPLGLRPANDYSETGDASLVSADRDTLIVPARLADTSDGAVEELLAAVRAQDGRDGVETAITGVFTADADFRAVSESDLRTGELIGIGVALLVLLVVFGALVASLVPLLLAVISIAVALGLTALVGQAFELSFFVVNMLVMMGLAVGIDYALFVVSRFREERARGREVVDAVGVAGATASRAVLFSGVTVVLALLGMLLVPTTIFRSLAIGAILAVLVAVAAALTLLPAVLRLLGDRVDALRLPLVGRASLDPDRGLWARVARAVMRRPGISLGAAVALLVAAAIPFFGIQTGFAGVATLPDSFASKQGFQLIDAEFGYADADPVEIVLDGDVRSAAGERGIAALTAALAGDDAFGPAEAPLVAADGRTALLRVPLAGDGSSRGALDAVDRLRDDLAPAALDGTGVRALVGGTTAENLDFTHVTDTYLPIVIALVLGLSFVLLAIAFRSLVVPATSIVMNLLSVGAAYGLMVLVFQHGWLASTLGFQQVETIEAWIPLFLFSVLFGLSMDYHVFLLSRIRERYDLTRDNAGSIAFGVGSTARIITGAALIMVAVFGGFAAGELVMFQQMGFGLGVAVLLDATVVRTVLVPAVMRLLGDRNWYLPRRLEWLPRLEVEAAREPRPGAASR